MKNRGRFLAAMMAFMMVFSLAVADETVPEEAPVEKVQSVEEPAEDAEVPEETAGEETIEEAPVPRFSQGYARVSGKIYRDEALDDFFGSASGIIWVVSRTEMENPDNDRIRAKIAYKDEILTVYMKAEIITPIEDQEGFSAEVDGIEVSETVKLPNASIELPVVEEQPAEEQPEEIKEEQPVEEQQVEEEKGELAEEQQIEEIKEEPVEEQQVEEVKEESVEEQPIEEVKEEPVEEQQVEEVKEEPVEEQQVEEVKEEPAEEQQVEEVKEEPVVEEQPVEEVKEELVKELQVEEVKEEPVEELPVEEVKEEPTEEQPIEKVEEEPTEEQQTETVEEVKEEPAEEQKAEEVVEQPAALVITAQPVDATAFLDDPVVLRVTAENAAAYQWQYSDDGGQTWKNSEAETAKTAELDFAMTEGDHQRLYHCVLIDLNGYPVFSEPARVALTVGDFTVEDVVYSVIDGDLPVNVMVKSYAGDASDLSIPECPRYGYTVVMVGEGAFEGNLNLVSLDLPDTAVQIGDRAFKGCKNLRVIN